MPDETTFRSGFVAIVGAPNTGKSTLLNRLLGQKISITSQKPQTTRNRILGVVHRDRAQMIFVDTPGIHRAKGPLNERIVDEAFSVLSEADMVLFMVDASHPDERSEGLLLERMAQVKAPVILALNKIDLVSRETLLMQMDQWSKAHDFTSLVPVCATRGDQVEDLMGEMERHLPEGPPFFPEDTLTDLPQRFIVAEMVREKVFRLTGQEIPYGTAVTVESFKEKGRMVHIHATIHVERDSQKGILIGKRGQKLKQIGEEARSEIERLLEARVFLKLFVRVQKNWSRDTRALRRFGYG